MTLFTYTLFLTNDVAGFVKCRETRSTHSMTMIFCYEGEINVVLNGQTIHIGPNNLFVRIPTLGAELGPYQMSDDYRFIQVTVDEETFSELMYAHMRVEPRWWQKLEYLRKHPVFELQPESIEFCEAYFNLLRLELQSPKSDYRAQIIKALARAASMEMFNFLDRMLQVPTEAERRSVDSSDYIFQRFLSLLQQNPHQREVQWFAKQINITPKYLSEICKARSGMSASEWIAKITVAELKQRLRHSTLSIRDISNEMEFPNVSFFCQYTKKHIGMTPNHYRKQRN